MQDASRVRLRVQGPVVICSEYNAHRSHRYIWTAAKKHAFPYVYGQVSYTGWIRGRHWRTRSQSRRFTRSVPFECSLNGRMLWTMKFEAEVKYAINFKHYTVCVGLLQLLCTQTASAIKYIYNEQLTHMQKPFLQNISNNTYGFCRNAGWPHCVVVLRGLL